MARRQPKRRNDLKRRTGTRRPKRTFLVLCEGTVTEPEYITALRQLQEVHRVARVDIQVDKARSGNVPLPLVDAAIEARQQKRERGDEIDEVWCLFDVEAPQPHPNLSQALAKANKNGIHTAVSNPCFELWLLLHFDEHKAWLSTEDAVQLRRKRDGSTGKEVDGESYMPLRNTAIENARNLRDHHSDNNTSPLKDNPSSGVHRLLEAIESGSR